MLTKMEIESLVVPEKQPLKRSKDKIMPQPNKGTHGTPNVSQPVQGPAGSKPTDSKNVMFGAPGGKGTKGSK